MLEAIKQDSLLFSFFVIGALNFLAVISPGPDFAVVVKTALTQPRRPALFTALGVALGILVHVTYCILGLAIVITHSLILFDIVKYCGAAYIIYLGIQGVFAKAPVSNNQTVSVQAPPLSVWRALQRGFFCNALNPKAGMFFLGLFTLVVKPTTPIWAQMLYGIEMSLITFAWFAFLTVVITHANVKAKIGRLQYYLTKLMGGLLIAFGLRLWFLQFK